METEATLSEAFDAVVLAAGAGVRFGGGKLLADYRGAPLLHAALASAFAAPVRSVSVVTGHDAEAVAAAARAFDPRVRVVHAVDHREGMGASLRAGVSALPGDSAALLLFLGDMPRVPEAAPAALAAAIKGGAPAAAATFKGRRGHPVAFTRELYPALLALKGDQGARDVLAGLGDRLALVEAPDDGVLIDVDAPADLDRLRP